MSFNSQTIDAMSDINKPDVVKPSYVCKGIVKPSENVQRLIKGLGLQNHPEGGYFKETDRSPLLMQNPYYPGHNDGRKGNYLQSGDSNEPVLTIKEADSLRERKLSPLRNYSTLIHYLITCDAPMGRFHVNRSRIIHILQRGRGQYVLIYPGGRLKTFVVGFNTDRGEVDQWVVPGGVYKASFLLPLDDENGESADDHLLISEIVVPGFDFEDHKFMPSKKILENLVGTEKAGQLEWLLGKH